MKQESREINLSSFPPIGPLIMVIDGQVYKSYYRRGKKVFIRPYNPDQVEE